MIIVISYTEKVELGMLILGDPNLEHTQTYIYMYIHPHIYTYLCTI